MAAELSRSMWWVPHGVGVAGEIWGWSRSLRAFGDKLPILTTTMEQVTDTASAQQSTKSRTSNIGKKGGTGLSGRSKPRASLACINCRQRKIKVRTAEDTAMAETLTIATVRYGRDPKDMQLLSLAAGTL